MYHTLCDWCGEWIDVRRAYIKMPVCLVTTELQGYDHKRKEETEPTRFFHVTPRRSEDEWDRLGLTVEHEEIGDCCYTRALKAIEGPRLGFETPDAGLEWRLLAVDPECDEESELDREALWKSETLDTGKKWSWLRSEPPFRTLGLEMLCSPRCTPCTWVEAGVKTVGDLRRAIVADRLTDVPGIGPKRKQQIEVAVATFLDDVGEAKETTGEDASRALEVTA